LPSALTTTISFSFAGVGVSLLKNSPKEDEIS